MTAPAAPVLKAHSNGSTVRISFPAVPTAATYNLYAAGTTAPTTLVMAGLTGLDYTFLPLDNPTYIRITAVNVGSEESAYSNEVRLGIPDSGRRITKSDPFGAYDRRDA